MFITTNETALLPFIEGMGEGGFGLGRSGMIERQYCKTMFHVLLEFLTSHWAFTQVKSLSIII